MDLSGLDDIKIHFIVGPGRTGTTLLVALLNEYPDCIAAPEIHHFVYFYKKYRDVAVVSESLIRDYKTHLALFARKKEPLIGPLDHTLIDSLHIGQPITYAQLTKLAYLGLFGKKGIGQPIRVMIDKNPYYSLKIDLIKQVFPDARILALTRDYRAYVLSNRQSQKPSVTQRTVSYYACVWNLYMRYVIRAEAAYPGAVKVVKYEDIALQKEKAVKEIVEFFGLAYSESIFDFHISIRQKIRDIGLQGKKHERMMKKLKDLSSPINPDRVEAWKKALTEQQMRQADLISGELGKRYGYEPQTKASFSKRLLCRLLALPALLRVKTFELLRSTEFHFYYIYRAGK